MPATESFGPDLSLRSSKLSANYIKITLASAGVIFTKNSTDAAKPNKQNAVF